MAENNGERILRHWLLIHLENCCDMFAVMLVFVWKTVVVCLLSIFFWQFNTIPSFEHDDHHHRVPYQNAYATPAELNEAGARDRRAQRALWRANLRILEARKTILEKMKYEMISTMRREIKRVLEEWSDLGVGYADYVFPPLAWSIANVTQWYIRMDDDITLTKIGVSQGLWIQPLVISLRYLFVLCGYLSIRLPNNLLLSWLISNRMFTEGNQPTNILFKTMHFAALGAASAKGSRTGTSNAW